ncbi:hypothetical protein I6N90_06530 [Paenibacillus sp. GSMTC-2017]|uniref:hypothetical protein n=1 Tax=Paenibacillus sp. GSMTC-2017 TaxID=2794350 RepID=UPI0018D9EF26|nr:hypothetical protein [Paenibacillus sp. GSMTC-2017]MBH5317470.1 hypothetical protein [Paenibacillus sp. GSMTC-2017]
MKKMRPSGLLFEQNGAVTIFAVIVLSSLLLFFSVLIDYARIAAFHMLAEDAARTSTRSVLSAYDSWLYERYGLFGRGGTEGNEIFKAVMKGNSEATKHSSSDWFNLLDTKVESAVVQPASVLGEHPVFKRQLQEEMKYKAPIDFTLEVIAKFTPLAQGLKESSNAVQTLEQLRKLYEKREKLLEQSLLLQEQAVDALISSEALPLVPVGAGGSGGGITSLSLTEGFNTYMTQVEHDAVLQEGQLPIFTSSIAQYESDVSSLTNQLRSFSSKLEQRHSKLLSDAIIKVEGAEQLNLQMERVLLQANTNVPNGYDGVAGKKVPGSGAIATNGNPAQELADIKKSGQQLIRKQSWFADYTMELRLQGTRNTTLTSEFEQLASRWTGAMSKPLSAMDQAHLVIAQGEITKAYTTYETQYSLPGSIIVARRASVLDSSIKDQLAVQQQKKESLWVQASRMMQGLSSIPNQSGHHAVFQKVQDRYKQNLLYNQQLDDATGSSQRPKARDANEAAEQSATFTDGLFSGMSDMLSQSRDYFYLGEYAVNKFSFFEPQQLRMLFQNGDVEGVAQMTSFHNQEVEYVLYGFHDPLGNLIAAYGELFAIRMAIRTMEGLVVSRTLGHPLLILSAALIYGLEKTMEDMISFATRGSAPLSKYVKVEMSYTDYLRVFMLLHGGMEEKRLGRIIAVIEQSTGLTLTSVPAGITSETKVSMELWFLPGVMSMLGRFDLLKGKVVGNRYETTQTMGSSY